LQRKKQALCHHFAMKKVSYCYLVFLAFIYTSCSVSHTYLQSPLDVTANTYNVVPMRSDSIKSAVYANGNFLAGTSNYQGRDGIIGFQGNVYRSHSLGIVNAYYGTGLLLGNYHVGDYYYTKPRSQNYDTAYHFQKSTQSFGGYGLNGGMSVALPFPNRKGEWRIGFETALYREFGHYLNYRKSFENADTVIDILATGNTTKTIGLTMEFIWKKKHGTIFSYKTALDWSFVNPNNFTGDESENVPFCFSNTLEVTRNNFTGFTRFSIGDHATSLQLGIAFRVQKIRR
jgi:hypothetical protein